MLSVLITIPVTVILVVPLDLGAEGLRPAATAPALAIVLGLIFYNRRRLAPAPDRPLLKRMMASACRPCRPSSRSTR